MKEIIKTREIKQEIKLYVSEDNKEFEHMEDCIKYERCKLEEELNTVEYCKNLENYANFNGEENMECHDYRWFCPKNLSEIAIINKFLGSEGRVGEESIGKWICIEISDDSSWVSTLEDGINYARFLLDTLGYDMKITKRKEEKMK